MDELNWRLRVYPPTGGEPRIIQRDVSFVRGLDGRGLRLQVTPEGDCTSGVFTARGSGILLSPLDAVQAEYLMSGVWVPLWFGEVRQGGNARDVNGEDYNLTGFSQRLGEVLLSVGFKAPKQAAHLTIRAAIQDIITSGQLGTPALVEYVEALCPDLGFDAREIKDAGQQTLSALLDQLAEDGNRYGVAVRWGVDAQRRFFARPARTEVRNLTAEGPIIAWKPPVAQTPWTAVLWFVAQRPDKSWITHLSVSPDAARYGLRTKRLSLSNVADLWVTTEGTFEMWTRASGEEWAKEDPQPEFDISVLTDGKASANAPRVTFSTPKMFVALRFHPAEGATVERVVFAASSAYGGLDVTQAPPSMTDYDPEDTTLDLTLTSSDPAFTTGTTTAPEPGYWVHLANRNADPARTSHQIDVWEFRPESINTELLDALAAHHYRPPAQEPADIETVVFVPPVELPGRIRVTGATVGPDYENALSAAEYRISSRGMLMGWLAGQADDPAAQAQADLIKRGDAEAVINAITAPT